MRLAKIRADGGGDQEGLSLAERFTTRQLSGIGPTSRRDFTNVRVAESVDGALPGFEINDVVAAFFEQQAAAWTFGEVGWSCRERGQGTDRKACVV